MESDVHSTRDYAIKKIFCPSFPPVLHSLSTKTKPFFNEHFFCSVQMKETNKNNQQVVKRNWKYSLQNVRKVDLHLCLGEPNRFVFGCQNTEEKCSTTEEKPVGERSSTGGRVDHSISSFFFLRFRRTRS
jgi:hypothetical protein